MTGAWRDCAARVLRLPRAAPSATSAQPPPAEGQASPPAAGGRPRRPAPGGGSPTTTTTTAAWVASSSAPRPDAGRGSLGSAPGRAVTARRFRPRGGGALEPRGTRSAGGRTIPKSPSPVVCIRPDAGGAGAAGSGSAGGLLAGAGRLPCRGEPAPARRPPCPQARLSGAHRAGRPRRNLLFSRTWRPSMLKHESSPKSDGEECRPRFPFTSVTCGRS